MFEAEVGLQRRSSFMPVLLLVCLVGGIASMVTYVIFQIRAKTPLSAQEANAVVTAALQGPGPAVIHFRSGLVVSSVDEKTGDPNYRLLEKAGILKLAKAPHDAELISVTPGGEQLVAAIPGFKKWKDADGTFIYQVPLAQRQLVGITDIKMNGVNNAIVQYTWKWVPNQMGDVFDAGGTMVKSFNLWDRQTLINKYEAAFYHEPMKSTLPLMRTDQGWKIGRLE